MEWTSISFCGEHRIINQLLRALTQTWVYVWRLEIHHKISEVHGWCEFDLKNKFGNSEHDECSNSQPIQLGEYWNNMISSTGSGDNMCQCIQYELSFVQILLSYTGQQGVAVVEPGKHNRACNYVQSVGWHRRTNMVQCTNVKITSFAHIVHVHGTLRQVTVKIMPRLLILSDKSMGDPSPFTTTTSFNNFTRCHDPMAADSNLYGLKANKLWRSRSLTAAVQLFKFDMAVSIDGRVNLGITSVLMELESASQN